MKDLIFYPDFESTNHDWLKFALLYIDRLNPIIPPTGDTQLSQLYSQLRNETDLIHFHRPEYEEGYLSSLDAIDIAERIAANPTNFDLLLGHVNAVNTWTDKSLHTYKLYEEKFSHEWEHYCIEKGYATRTPGGLLISEDLGALYMVVLANTIADKQGKSPITDSKKIDKLSYFLKSKAPVQTTELSNARAVMKLKLPAEIGKISFKKIIDHRNSGNFKKYLKAFHRELDNFYANIEAGETTEDFVKKYETASKDYNENILSLSFDTITFLLGAGMLIHSANYTQSDFFKTVVVGGSALVVKSGLSLHKTWKNSQPKRHCRRYLTELDGLK